MASNFSFLDHHFNHLLPHATEAESLVYSSPRSSCFYSRFTLEQAVIWLYDNDPYLKLPYQNNLGALIREQTFKDNLKPGLFEKIKIIVKMGNCAAHQNINIKYNDALHTLQELFHFLYWLCRYYSPDGRNLGEIKFNSDILAYLARSPTLCFQSKIIKQVWDESPVTCYNGQQGGAGRVPHYKMP